jgi:hypothetical protein
LSTGSQSFTHEGGFGDSLASPAGQVGQNGRFSSSTSSEGSEMYSFLLVLAMMVLLFVSQGGINTANRDRNLKINRNENQNNNPFNRGDDDYDYYD